MADVTIDFVQHVSDHLVYRAGKPFARHRSLPGLAPCIKGLVHQAAINAADFFIFLHAGVLSDGRSGMLFPGSSGSGKSCLTAALVKGGFEYFSDEVALLERHTLRVKPFPIAPGVKHGAWDLLRPLYPTLRDLAVHRREDGKRVRYLPPPVEAFPADLASGRMVSHEVFPRYAPDAGLSLTALPKMETLQRLLDDCMALQGTLTRQTVEAFVGWLEQTACYDLGYADLSDAVAAMGSLWRDASGVRTGDRRD